MSVVDDRFVVVDIETTGLEENHEVILEIGFAIYSAESLLKLDSIEVQIWDEQTASRQKVMLANRGNKNFKYVLDMHTKSGLWDACEENGVKRVEAQEILTRWLTDHDITVARPIKERDPWFGSSVDFDIAFLKHHMPMIPNHFHYRKIDISSVKELCRRQAPSLYSKLDQYTSKRELHRVTPDIEDTFSEFTYYNDNFFWTERG